MNIDELYLKRLNDKYNNWIDNIYEGDVLVVDKDHEDFVSDLRCWRRYVRASMRSKTDSDA